MALVCASLITAVTENLTLEFAAFIAGVVAALGYLRQLTLKAQAASRLTAIATRRLGDLAEGMADQIGEHHARVGEFSAQLAPFCETNALHAPAVTEAAAKTVAANDKLRRRLERAGRKLRRHSRDLRMHRADSLRQF